MPTDTQRLDFLIENEYVVVSQFDRYWLTEDVGDGDYVRICTKDGEIDYPNARSAIDACMPD